MYRSHTCGELRISDINKLHGLGWRHTIELREGITAVYKEFSKNYDAIVSKYK